MGNLLKVKIAQMTREDVGFYDRLGPLFGSRDVHRELGAPMFDDPGKTWWIATKGKALAGVCAMKVEGGKVVLCSAYVVPEYRRRGVYQALFERRMSEARKLGGTLRSVVTPAVRPLLARHGFEVVRELTKYTVMEGT